MNDIRHGVQQRRRRRGRPRRSRDARRLRARAGRVRDRGVRRAYRLWVYLHHFYGFKFLSLVARIDSTAPDGPGPELVERYLRANLFPSDPRAWSIYQSLGPRIIKLTRHRRSEALALEFIARSWKLSPDAARRLVREGRVAFPEVVDLFREFSPVPECVASLTRWLRVRAARVRRRPPTYVHDWDEERKRLNGLNAELELIYQRQPPARAFQKFEDWMKSDAFLEKIGFVFKK